MGGGFGGGQVIHNGQGCRGMGVRLATYGGGGERGNNSREGRAEDCRVGVAAGSTTGRRSEKR